MFNPVVNIDKHEQSRERSQNWTVLPYNKPLTNYWQLEPVKPVGLHIGCEERYVHLNSARLHLKLQKKVSKGNSMNCWGFSDNNW